ncbi:FecR domain-containing protein [Thauera sp. CAU 1555]|uniref:FecR domain-containing protein n=1 Tax=Thauera sedimentorum TaxID=2767595 RepID=A0ABR9BCH0_9RHOO|nr:FecR domain-containing protein [Thauera sedimentorum]MBC9073120.1 FecR domain-containing protein [Thauera sedimentorum]MBD8504039.1 FecR domain-containing protein [Thauera sedimentorum]
MPPEHQPGMAALQQAAEWFATLGEDGADEAQRRRWQAWLAASAEHRHAWARVEAVSERFARIGQQSSPEAARHALSMHPSSGRRQALKLLAGCGVTLLGGWLGHTLLASGGLIDLVAAWTAGERTAVGEVRELALDDGGRLWLNTASAADIDYGPQWRRIALRAGELLISTAADRHQPPRPLVVDTPHGRLTALGTRFSVRLSPEATQVSVFEGAVEIATDGKLVGVLPAGRQARFSRHALGPFDPAETARESWVRGMLVADNRRLDDFIAELARYLPVHLEVAPEVATLRLVGVYPMREPVSDFGRTMMAIQQALPVRARRMDAHHWRIEAR